MGRMAGKVAIVTGGASGIGLACAEMMAEHGATVVLTDIDRPGGLNQQVALRARGFDVNFIAHDVTKECEWQCVIAETVRLYGRLDVLLNNAGIGHLANVETETLEHWRRTQLVNLDSVFIGTQQAIRQMKRNGGGSIINMSSIEGIVGEPNIPAYNASKGGVRAFTKSAALHCAQLDCNIRVNSVHPGFVATRMISDALGVLSSEAAQGFTDELLNHRVPMRRIGTAREIAWGVLFLASDESSFMTGSELVIDGGYTAQ